MELEFVEPPPAKTAGWRLTAESLLDREGEWAILVRADDHAAAEARRRAVYPSLIRYLPRDKRVQTAVRDTTLYARVIPRVLI